MLQVTYGPITFPSVTMCNKNAIRKSQFYLGGEELTKVLEKHFNYSIDTREAQANTNRNQSEQKDTQKKVRRRRYISIKKEHQMAYLDLLDRNRLNKLPSNTFKPVLMKPNVTYVPQNQIHARPKDLDNFNNTIDNSFLSTHQGIPAGSHHGRNKRRC